MAQNNNGVGTFFYYAGAQRIEERNFSNQPVYQYFFASPGSDQLLFRQDATHGRLWYLGDAMGNTTHLVNDGGQVVEQYLYDAYGLPTVYSPAGSLQSGGSAYDNRYLFGGSSAYEWLAAPELCYCRARFYLPAHGRWLQPDPIGQDGGLNLYAYCGNDPVNRTDPSGNLSWGDVVNFFSGIVDSIFGGGGSANSQQNGNGNQSGSQNQVTDNNSDNNTVPDNDPSRVVVTGDKVPNSSNQPTQNNAQPQQLNPLSLLLRNGFYISGFNGRWGPFAAEAVGIAGNSHGHPYVGTINAVGGHQELVVPVGDVPVETNVEGMIGKETTYDFTTQTTESHGIAVADADIYNIAGGGGFISGTNTGYDVGVYGYVNTSSNTFRGGGISVDSQTVINAIYVGMQSGTILPSFH